jgi:hypothetical protein
MSYTNTNWNIIYLECLISYVLCLTNLFKPCRFAQEYESKTSNPDAFGPFSFVGLLVGLDCYHLSILFLFDQVWCSNLFILLVMQVLEILLVGFCFGLSPVFALHWYDLWPSMWHSLQITVSPSTGLFTSSVVLS